MEKIINMIKIIDKQKRSVLGEGRDFGMGFAFLKKIDDKTFETVQPISPCKDYLNDVVYAEATGKKCIAYGLSYNKIGIFNDSDEAYLVISILDYHSGMNYSHKKWEIEALDKGIESIKSLLNFFEKSLGFKKRSTFVKVKENLYVLTIPIEWTASSYCISLVSLICRSGRWYDKKTDPFEYFTKFTEFSHDVYLVKGAIPAMKKMIETKMFKQDLSLSPGGTTIHNCGILKYVQATDLIK